MWQVIAASAPGSSHVLAGLRCQDMHDSLVVGDRAVLAAVADGLGSAPMSDFGALVAIEAVLGRLQEIITSEILESDADWQRALRTAFTHAASELRRVARENEKPVRDFATTLIAIALTSDRIAVGHIGDGGVVARFESGELATLSPPAQGEYANETASLAGVDALEQVRYSVRTSAAVAVALFTDGLQRLCLNTPAFEPYPPFFTPFFDALPSINDTLQTCRKLEEFLCSERVRSRSDDDVTLVIVGPRKMYSVCV